MTRIEMITDLSSNLTKDDIKERYYELRKVIFDSLKDLNGTAMWNAYSLNFELLNLYRKLYSTEKEKDKISLRKLSDFTYSLDQMNKILEEIKIGVDKLNKL